MPSMCALLAVWVNGVEVGYSQDSKLPCEFDITAHLRYDGQPDVIALLVLCWWIAPLPGGLSQSQRPSQSLRFGARNRQERWH